MEKAEILPKAYRQHEFLALINSNEFDRDRSLRTSMAGTHTYKPLQLSTQFLRSISKNGRIPTPEELALLGHDIMDHKLREKVMAAGNEYIAYAQRILDEIAATPPIKNAPEAKVDGSNPYAEFMRNLLKDYAIVLKDDKYQVMLKSSLDSKTPLSKIRDFTYSNVARVINADNGIGKILLNGKMIRSFEPDRCIKCLDIFLGHFDIDSDKKRSAKQLFEKQIGYSAASNNVTDRDPVSKWTQGIVGFNKEKDYGRY